MLRVGYHASHEQFTPGDLLSWAKLAEQAGFDCAMSSDHFHPWSERQGQSGFAWSWLGAAMEATRLPFGVISAPGWRYHPAILAQAAATLCQMYPGRLWFALGSGEAINEHMTGLPWPEKRERNARLRESADVIRALFAGETVTHRGRIDVVEAKLYTRPDRPPPLIGAAVTEETAEWLGGWADGLLTVSAKPEQLRKVVDAFRRGGGEGKPLFLQVGLSWAPSEEEALRQAHEQWRSNVLGGDVNWTLRTPRDFDMASRFVMPEDMRESVLISADVARHAAWLAEYAGMGFSEIHLHHVGTNQSEFIEAFGARVLPELGQLRHGPSCRAGADAEVVGIHEEAAMDMSAREIYHSPNGDRWHLVRDPRSGRVFVRHEANPASGGRRTEVDVRTFLSQGGSGPEHQELLRLIGTSIGMP